MRTEATPQSMDLPNSGLNQSKTHLEVPNNVVDVASAEKSSVTPDPRWPYLNRWTASKPSTLPTAKSPETVLPATKVSSQPELESMDVQIHKPGEDSTSAIPENQALLSTTPMMVKDSCEVSEPAPLSTLKGAWTVPLNILHKKPYYNANKRDQVALTAEEESLKAYSKDFPWAAKMDQSLRNLHRVTMPEYLEDGTPMVNIPSHVLLEGLENQKEFVVGQFYRCVAPSGGMVHAVLNKIWGRKCHISIKKVGEFSYLFHIPDEPTRRWIIQRGLWHVDDCLMFVSAWSKAANITIPEITTVPAWLTLKNIPSQLYSIKGIKWIASGIGEPMQTSKPWLDPTQIGEAKILVEVKLDKPFPQRVALKENCGTITMVDVVYSWLPSKCSKCGHLGHKATRCLGVGVEKVVDSAVDLSSTTCSSNNNSPTTVTNNALGPVSGSADAVTHKGFHHVKIIQSSTPATRDISEKISKLASSSSSRSRPANEKIAVTDTSDAFHVIALPLEKDVTQSTEFMSVRNNSASQAAEEVVPDSLNDDTGSSTPVAHATTAAQQDGQFISSPVKAFTPSKNSPKITDIATSKQGSSPSTHVEQRIHRSSSSVALATNRFAELQSSGDEDEPHVSDEENDPLEFLTPSGKRILRERPVKPSTKVKEMQWQIVAHGRGNRGRGNRGGRG